jgi:chromosome segregation ATPase
MKTREELLTENQRLRARNKTLTAVAAKAKHDLTIKNSHLKKVKSATTTLKKQVTALKEKVKEEREERAHRDHTDRKEKRHEDWRRDFRTMEYSALFGAEKIHAEKIQSELETSKAALEKSRLDFETVKAESEKYKADLENTKADLAKTKTDLEKTKADLEKTKAKLEKTIPTLSQQVKSVLGSESTLQRDLDALRKDLQTKQEENKALQAKLNELQQAQEESKADKQTVRQNLKKSIATDALSECQSRAKSCQIQKERQTTLKDQALKALKATSESDALLTTVRAENERLQSELKELRRIHNETQAQLSRVGSLKTTVTQSLEQAQKSKSELESEITALRQQRVESESRHISQLQGKNIEFESKMSEMVSRHNAQLQEKQQEIDAAATIRLDLESTISTLMNQIDEMATNHDIELQRKTQEIATLESQIEALHQELGVLKSSHNRKQQERAAAAGTQSDLESKISTLKNQIDQMTTNHDIELQRKTQEIAALASQIHALHQELGLLKSSHNRKQQERAAAAETQSDLESKVAALHARNQELVANLAALTQNMQDMASSHGVALQGKQQQIARQIQRVRTELDSIKTDQLKKEIVNSSSKHN